MVVGVPRSPSCAKLHQAVSHANAQTPELAERLVPPRLGASAGRHLDVGHSISALVIGAIHTTVFKHKQVAMVWQWSFGRRRQKCGLIHYLPSPTRRSVRGE